MTLTELLDNHGISYRTAGQHHHARPGWLQLDCPWCSPSSGRFRLGWNLAHGYCSCWTCGSHKGGQTLSELTGKPVWECIKLIGGQEEYPLQKRPVGRLVYPKGVIPLRSQHTRYLERRGFDPQSVERLWRVQGIAHSVRLPWRLFIPVHSQGKVVSWTTRSIGDVKNRYHCARPEEEAVSAKSLLYGEDHTRHAVVVCEGPLDVWAIGPGAVATMGISYTRAQLCKISKYPVRVVCFDADGDGQRRARKLCDELAVFPGTTRNIILESGKDPAAASKDELIRLRHNFLGEY